jgi:hypothetical protein
MRESSFCSIPVCYNFKVVSCKLLRGGSLGTMQLSSDEIEIVDVSGSGSILHCYARCSNFIIKFFVLAGRSVSWGRFRN